jgi:hypothetical protein
MQQRQLTKGAPANGKKGAAPPPPSASTPPASASAPPAAPTADASTSSPDNKPIRSVGPTFLPQQQK